MNFYDEAIESKHSYLQIVSRTAAAIRKEVVNKPQRIDLEHLFDDEIAGLREADSYFWDSRVTQMVLASGKQLPDSTEFSQGWLHGRCGWWWFGRSSPLIGLSTEGHRRYVSALLHHFDHGELHISTYEAIGSGMNKLGSFGWREGERLDSAIHRLDEAQGSEADGAPLVRLAAASAAVFDDLADYLADLRAKGEPSIAAIKSEDVSTLRQHEHSKANKVVADWKDASSTALRIFACGSLWLQQKIVVTEDAELTRHARKRLERAGINEPCRVVYLRRKEYAGASGTEHGAVDWAWQWAVRGHWRNQPTKNGIRLTWIHPFIKGPESKPLKPSAAKVFVVNQ